MKHSSIMDFDTNDEESVAAFRVTMADGLRPLIKVNYLLGVSTFTINSSGHIHHPHKIFNRFRVIFAILFISLSTSVSFYRLVGTLLWAPYYENTPQGDFGRFNKMVELICQFISNIFPTMLIFIGLFRSSELTRFFQEMSVYNAGISGFANPKWVCHVTRRVFTMHMVMLFCIGGIMEFRLFTTVDSGELELKQKFNGWGVGFGVHIIFGVLVGLLSAFKLLSNSFLECFNVALATCFSKVIDNLNEFILKEANNWKAKYLGYPKTIVQNGEFSDDQLIDVILSSKSKLKNDGGKISSDNSREKEAVSHMTPGQQLCYVIRKLQHVAKMQNETNSLFGSILVLDIGFTLFMLVLLKYLLIRNMGFHVARLRQMYLGNSTYDATSFSTTIAENDEADVMLTTTSTPASSANSLQELIISSPYGWLFFLTFDVCYSLRLIVLTKCLGNVNTSAVKINAVLANVLGKAQKLMDQVSSITKETDYNKKENMDNHSSFKTAIGTGNRPLITSIEADTVLAFLAVNTTQPIAYSAGGVLTFSGSTIMLISSVVISYLVFLLQAS